MRACREFPAFPSELVPSAIASFVPMPAPRRARADTPRGVARTRHPVRQMRALEPVLESREARSEHPLVVGALLLVVPPIGVAALWASARFTFAGKLAVTLFTAFAMLLAAATAIAFAIS